MLVPKIAVIRKEEGATAAASHLPSPWRNSAGWSREGRTGRDSPRRFHFMGKPHKIPQMSYLRYAERTNERTNEKRRRFSDFHFCLALQNK